MKKTILTLLVCLLTAVGAAAQGYTYEELQQIVAATQPSLPLNMGANTKLVALSVNRTEYRQTIDAGGRPIVDKKKWNRTWRGSVVDMADNPASRPLIQSFVANNINMTFHFYNFRGGETVTISISPKELDAALKGIGRLTPQEKFDQLVENEQSTLPIEIGNGNKETRFEPVGGMLEIEFSMNPQVASIAAIQDNREAVKANMIKTAVGDLSFLNNARICSDAGYGIKFIYRIGDETTSISFTADELRAITQ